MNLTAASAALLGRTRLASGSVWSDRDVRECLILRQTNYGKLCPSPCTNDIVGGDKSPDSFFRAERGTECWTSAATPSVLARISSLVGALIPHAQITVADLQATVQLENDVSTSGVLLPFRDGAFDLVCSLDTLEHTPATGRETFLRELLRV